MAFITGVFLQAITSITRLRLFFGIKLGLRHFLTLYLLAKILYLILHLLEHVLVSILLNCMLLLKIIKPISQLFLLQFHLI